MDGLAMGLSMTALTRWNLTMIRMTLGAGELGVPGIALNQQVICRVMTAGTALLRLFHAEDNIYRLMRIDMAP